MIEPTQDPGVEIPPEAKKALRKEVAEHITGQPTRKLFGTFSGVFTPTLLTILGVIMYLREGWVVGNAGLLGACSVSSPWTVGMKMPWPRRIDPKCAAKPFGMLFARLAFHHPVPHEETEEVLINVAGNFEYEG